jgi:hypothetical protein
MKTILALNVLIFLLILAYANYGVLVAYQRGFDDGETWELGRLPYEIKCVL